MWRYLLHNGVYQSRRHTCVEYTAGLVSDAVAPDRCAMEFRKTIAAVRRGFSTSAMTVMHLAVLMSSPHLLRHTLSMSTNAQCMMQKMWG